MEGRGVEARDSAGRGEGRTQEAVCGRPRWVLDLTGVCSARVRL